MVPILSMSLWVSLSNEQRIRIRSIFNIPRSQHVHVDDGRIITDGTTAEDFLALTIEKMQTYLKSDVTDFHKLFDLVVARVQDEIEGKPIAEVNHNTITIVIPPEPKKRGRNPKINK